MNRWRDTFFLDVIAELEEHSQRIYLRSRVGQ